MSTQKQSGKLGRWFILTAKSTKLLKLVKLFKMLKFVKVFITFGTMAISIIAYSFLWGWKFAVGFVVMLFIHEMGHVIALKQKGYKASAPVFIPMFGAAVFMPKPKNAEDEAYIGYGGPFLGSLAALILLAIVTVLPSKSELLLRVGYVALFLNLFNLIPLRPLDGGKITQAVGGWFKYVGLALIFGLSLLIREPQMLLIWVLVMSDLPLKPWPKFTAAALCTTTMTALMLSGFGGQPWWVNGLDMILATTLTSSTYAVAKKYVPDISEEAHPPLSASRRAYWFLMYVGMAAVLIYAMHVTSGQIPPVVQVQ